MKIIQVCLSSYINPTFSYQDNVLPKYYVKLGYECITIAPQYYLSEEGMVVDTTYRQKLADGSELIRLPAIFGLSHKYNRLLRSFCGLYKILCEEKPDIIFLHSFQTPEARHVIRYKKKNPHVILIADNHADFSNSANKYISRRILHGILWKHFAKKIYKYCEQFYGVLPSRVNFLRTVYNLPSEKLKLLVMGADDEYVEQATQIESINAIRNKYGIRKEDFLIVTGGKIDREKWQTLNLMEAVQKMPEKNVKLLIFGSIEKEMEHEILEKCNNRIQYVGWMDNEMSYRCFGAADLVVFPGRHSVFWEQVVGLGIPLVVKYWDGTTHVDLDGNCRFIYQDTVNEIYTILKEIIMNHDIYKKMKDVAQAKGTLHFSYKKIAERSLQIEK